MKIQYNPAGRTAKQSAKLVCRYRGAIVALLAEKEMTVSELYMAIRMRMSAVATRTFYYEDLEACLWLLGYTGSETEAVHKKPPPQDQRGEG